MGKSDLEYQTFHDFSQGFYVAEEFKLYLQKQETKEFLVDIKDIKKVEERGLLGRFAFLEIKPGIRARKTLSGGLEFKVDIGSGMPFEIFTFKKEEYEILKNYAALEK
jgi:hypothetical protein